MISKQSITAPLSLSETAGVSLDLCADLEEIRLFLSAAGQMQFVWTRVTGPKELTLPLFDFSVAPRPFPKPSPGVEVHFPGSDAVFGCVLAELCHLLSLFTGF